MLFVFFLVLYGVGLGRGCRKTRGGTGLQVGFFLLTCLVRHRTSYGLEYDVG